MGVAPPFGLVDVTRTVGATRGDEAIARLAWAQQGLVTTGQLLWLGLSPPAITRRVQAGRLFRRHRGVYLVGHQAMTELTPPVAALLALGPAAVLSHWTALWLWGILEAPTDVVHVSVPAASARSRGGIHVHRMGSLDDRELRTRRGLPVVSPAAALLDVADTERPIEIERLLNAGRQRHLIKQGDLDRVIRRAVGRRGLAVLRTLFRGQTNDDFSRSEAERVLRNLIRTAGLPTPRRNLVVHGHELDFFWPELGLNVETDGYEWHSARDRLNSDRERDASLATFGIQVIRFTWDQLQRPHEVIAQQSAAIAIASERRRQRMAS